MPAMFTPQRQRATKIRMSDFVLAGGSVMAGCSLGVSAAFFGSGFGSFSFFAIDQSSFLGCRLLSYVIKAFIPMQILFNLRFFLE